MSVPTNRATFKEYCLRALGKPVIEINVADEQVDDRIDFALRTFYDFHSDGHDKVYYKYKVSQNNHSTAIYDITIEDGGTDYANGEALVFTGGNGSGAEGTVSTNSTGGITSLTFTNGTDFSQAPTVTVDTAAGTGANLVAQLGGFIPMPENIIGVVNLFDVGITSGDPLFSMRYQIVLNDLMLFNNLEIVPYYITMQNMALIQEVLVGKQPIRYNRYQDKLYVDMNWNIVAPDTFIIVEAYSVIDEATYPEIFGNRWLQEYATCQIKKQWGTNMKKFQGMQMPGGLMFNGQQIYDEAVMEEKELMFELVNTYSLPPGMMVG